MSRPRGVWAVFVVLMLALSMGGMAKAEEKVFKWKLATTWAPTLVPFIDAPKDMVKMVEKMSGGRLLIEIVTSDKHKKPYGVLDMVKDDEYEMGHSAAYYYIKKDVTLAPLTTMPFGMLPYEQYAWFYYGGGMALMQEAYAGYGVLSFPGGSTGNEMGGWFNKEINTLDDLKGLKMRIPGFGGMVMSELGVKVVNMPAVKLAGALKSGKLDALEWVGPGMDIALGFHKIAKYYYSGWHEPASEMQYLVNTAKYNELPEDLREILRVAMKVTAYNMYIRLQHMHGEAWATMKKEYPNIVIKSFPISIMDAMREANNKIIRRISAKNPMFKKIIDSKRSYQETIRAWTKISDFLYLVESL